MVMTGTLKEKKRVQYLLLINVKCRQSYRWLVDVTLVLRYQSWHRKRCYLMSHWYADIKVGTPKFVFFLLSYLMSHWYTDIKVGTPKIVVFLLFCLMSHWYADIKVGTPKFI
jgi:hypothetical protein